jgi:hypothetical protein
MLTHQFRNGVPDSAAALATALSESAPLTKTITKTSGHPKAPACISVLVLLFPAIGNV